MKYVAVSAIWLSLGGALAAMAHYGVLNDGVDAMMTVLVGEILAVLGTLAITH